MAQHLASPDAFLAAMEKGQYNLNGFTGKKHRNPSVKLVLEEEASKKQTSTAKDPNPPKEGESQMSPDTKAGSGGSVNDIAAPSLNILTRIYALENMIKHKFDDLTARIESLEMTRSADTASADHESDVEQEDSQPPAQQAMEFKWTPVAVRLMPPLVNLPLALQPLPLKDLTTFTLDFLQDYLGGEEFSAGVYFPASYPSTSPSKTHTANNQKMKRNKIYYVLDSDLEPFAPTMPGEHGAKLNMFFKDFDDNVNEAEIYQNVPLFICLDASDEAKRFAYLGNYSQTRWSDKLSYDQMSEIVPKRVKQFWATKLSDGDKRPAWLEEKLMEALVPRPNYYGKYPKLGSTIAEVHNDVNEYILDLGHWDQEAREKVATLTESAVEEAFERADASEEPGLRLQWEYLECIGFDRAFYYQLATELRKREREGSD